VRTIEQIKASFGTNFVCLPNEPRRIRLLSGTEPKVEIKSVLDNKQLWRLLIEAFLFCTMSVNFTVLWIYGPGSNPMDALLNESAMKVNLAVGILARLSALCLAWTLRDLLTISGFYNRSFSWQIWSTVQAGLRTSFVAPALVNLWAYFK